MLYFHILLLVALKMCLTTVERAFCLQKLKSIRTIQWSLELTHLRRAQTG